MRAREVIKKFEAFKNGETRKPYNMGYARRLNMELKDGVIELV